MSVLTSKFDILRGYPNGSGTPWSFPIKMNGTVPYSVYAGTIVTQESQNNKTVAALATTPNTGSAEPIQMWLTVEGNDDFSGQFVVGCNTVLLSSGIVWETDVFTAGTYAVGGAVSVSGGKVQDRGSNEQTIAYVLENNIATKGTITLVGAPWGK